MDTLKIVSFSKGGRPITALDIEVSDTYEKVRDSLEIKPGEKKPIVAHTARRWGGGRQAAETHENGTLKANWLIKGLTADSCLAALEAFLGEIEDAAPGKYIEFKPDGATYPVYYELRGTAVWTPAYRWVQFTGALSLNAEITFPIAPLAMLPRMDIGDDFAVDSTGDYTYDSGAGTVSVASGQLVPSSTAVKRFWHSSRGHGYGDCQATVKYTTGATVPNTGNSQTDLILKRLDSNNELRGKVWGNSGGSAYISIDKYDGGAATNLGVQAFTTLSSATSYWLRFRVEGNVLTVEHFTTEPTPMATPAQTLSYTLAGADATKFGTDIEGHAGLILTPTDTNWRWDDYRVEPFTYRNQTLPAKFALSGAIPGNAPALADLHVTPSGGSAAPVWALAGWTRRPTTPMASTVAPFGLIEAETGTDLSTWAVTADADYSGSSGLQATAAGAGTAAAMFAIDPSTLEPDDFQMGDLDLEVWGRFEIDTGLVSPKLTLSARPTAGTSFGAERFTGEFGSTGKLLTTPSSGLRFRFVRLGTLTLASFPLEPVSWKLRVAASWSAGSTGTFGFDRLLCVKARQRAAGPTGKANDANYPKFVASTSETQKIVRSDLSGRVASPPSNPFPDSGLGGSPIELPTDADLVVKLSSLVPDDPTSDATTEQMSHSATVHLAVTPRVFLVRG